jgi:hypothetical protein
MRPPFPNDQSWHIAWLTAMRNLVLSGHGGHDQASSWLDAVANAHCVDIGISALRSLSGLSGHDQFMSTQT